MPPKRTNEQLKRQVEELQQQLEQKNEQKKQSEKRLQMKIGSSALLIVLVSCVVYYGISSGKCELPEAWCATEELEYKKWNFARLAHEKLNELFEKCSNTICKQDSNDFESYCSSASVLASAPLKHLFQDKLVYHTTEGARTTEKEGLFVDCKNDTSWRMFVFGVENRDSKFRLFTDYIGAGIRFVREDVPKGSSMDEQLQVAKNKLDVCTQTGHCTYFYGFKIF